MCLTSRGPHDVFSQNKSLVHSCLCIYTSYLSFTHYPLYPPNQIHARVELSMRHEKIVLPDSTSRFFWNHATAAWPWLSPPLSIRGGLKRKERLHEAANSLRYRTFSMALERTGCREKNATDTNGLKTDRFEKEASRSKTPH